MVFSRNSCFMLMFAVITFGSLILILDCSNPAWAQDPFQILARQMAERITRSGKKTVAVTDFTDLQGNVSELGRYLAEKFSVTLVNEMQGFEVVDRTHLATLMKEHQFQQSALVDPASVKELGKIAGVDALITGSLTPMSENVDVVVKVLDTTTAKIIGSSSTVIPKTKTIEELLTRGVGSEDKQPQGKTGDASPEQKKTIPAAKIVEKESFTFELKDCTGAETIDCQLLITNSASKERELGMGWGGCRIIDESGDQYPIKLIQLGDTKYDWNLFKTLGVNVPIKARVHYEGVNPSAKTIVSLEHYFNIDGVWFVIQFRDVPILKK